MNKIRLAVSGVQGSFSEEAGLLYAQRLGKDVEIVFAVDTKGVLEAIQKDDIDFGIFPVVNSRGGLVRMSFRTMGTFLFEYVDELWFEVYQCMMCKDGVEKEAITQIASHPQAIAQCERHIKREYPNAKLIEWEDTAKAAQDLANGVLDQSCTAVIAPSRSAHLYNLHLLEKGIQDEHPNLTTFIIISKKQ